MANSVDSDQTAGAVCWGSLIRVCMVCSDLSVQLFRIFMGVDIRLIFHSLL